MEDKGLIFDAAKLSRNILNSLLPGREWEVCNIAIDEREMFRLEGYPMIPSAFGYAYDKVPTLLQQKGVIEAIKPDSWFITVTNNPESAEVDIMLDMVDDITAIARQKGYITNNEVVEYFISGKKYPYPKRLHGHFAILLNVGALRKFVQEHNSFETKTDSDLHEIWNKDFKFNDKENVLYLLPYGCCEFSLKNVPIGAKVNQRAVLVKAVTEAGEDGIGVTAIRSEFRRLGTNPPNNRRIDAMITSINERFTKKFKGATVALKNVGSHGTKRIKLSIKPLLKR